MIKLFGPTFAELYPQSAMYTEHGGQRRPTDAFKNYCNACVKSLDRANQAKSTGKAFDAMPPEVSEMGELRDMMGKYFRARNAKDRARPADPINEEPSEPSDTRRYSSLPEQEAADRAKRAEAYTKYGASGKDRVVGPQREKGAIPQAKMPEAGKAERLSEDEKRWRDYTLRGSDWRAA